MTPELDKLGDRMKRYEASTRFALPRKAPVMIRLDGKAFHTFCRNLEKPYDESFQKCMWSAAKALCSQVQGCQLAYVQSDEITLLLVDYTSAEAQPWFGNDQQKIVSLTAAICSVAFYQECLKLIPEAVTTRAPVFDSRVWILPKEEVANAFIWRQQDAERNSLAALCQAKFSAKQLHGKGRVAQHGMLREIGVDWDECSTPQKRGVCLVKTQYEAKVREEHGGGTVMRTMWVEDFDIPVFASAIGRAYIERFVYPDDENKGDDDGDDGDGGEGEDDERAGEGAVEEPFNFEATHVLVPSPGETGIAVMVRGNVCWEAPGTPDSSCPRWALGEVQVGAPRPLQYRGIPAPDAVLLPVQRVHMKTRGVLLGAGPPKGP